MTDDIIKQAEAAQQGVIQGPWELRDGFVYPLCIRFGLGSIREQDAHFIAWARTGVPELLAALKAERAENERLKQKLYNLGTACDTCGMIHCRCA